MSMQTNGQARKSLSSQIDRLDSMLEGLSENLNEAVAAAVKEAVRSVLKEVLASPDLTLAIRGSRMAAIPMENALNTDVTRPAQPAPAGLVRRAGQWIGRGLRAVVDTGYRSVGWAQRTCVAAIQGVKHACVSTWRHACSLARAAWERWQMLQWLTGPVLVALVIGAGVGVAAYSAEPVVAAITSGVGGFITTLAVQASLILRRLCSCGLAADDA